MTYVVKNVEGKFLQSGKKWVSEYPDAAEFNSKAKARKAAQATGEPSEILENYGLETETVVGVVDPGHRDIYATTFCNMGHDAKTGRPVRHECYILPPAAIKAEREDNFAEANRVLLEWERSGKRRMIRGR